MLIDNQELQWLKSNELTAWGGHVSQTLGLKKSEPYDLYGLSGACAGTLNGHIAVIVGGKEESPVESCTSFARLDLFDMNSNSWLTDYDICGELSHRIGHSIVTLDQNAYTFGGEPLEASQQQLKGDVFELSYKSGVLNCTDVTPINSDSSISSSPAPCERAWHASAAIIYREAKSTSESSPLKGMLILGGKSSCGAILSDVWILIVDVPRQKPRWQQLMPTGNSPLPLAYHNAVAIGEGNKVVVVGGREHKAINSSIHVLDLVTNAWSSIVIASEEPENKCLSRILTTRCCATSLVLQLPIDEETGVIRKIKNGDLKEIASQEAIVIFGGFSECEPALNPASMVIFEPQHTRFREVQVTMAGIKSYMGHATAVRPDRRGFFVFGGVPFYEELFGKDHQCFSLDSVTALNFWEASADCSSEEKKEAGENTIKTKILDIGDVYVGEMNAEQTQRQGRGKCSYANGDEYEGDWRNDQRCGQGVMRYASQQEMYTGQWESDQRHGYGIYEYGVAESLKKEAQPQNHKRYEGQWLYDQKHGGGTLTFENGSQLEGVWADDVLHTCQTCCLEKYDDGQNGICRYVGKVSDGVPHGKGESHYLISKEVFKGCWKNGSRSGQGVSTLLDGSIYQGEWRNGRRNGFGTFSDARTRSHYDGKWVGGLRCGRGVCKYANGCVYEGEWLNDKRHGTGRYAFNDGSSYDGAWLHDKFCGDGSFILGNDSAGKMLHSLYIINKAGGLVYQQDLSPSAPKLSSNDHLRLGSTFHSMHAIAALAAPTKSGGIDSLETSTFRLHCLQTLTGIKFFITAALGTTDLDVALQTVYELYVDFVLKNPFYELEMPIRCSLFNVGLKTFVDKFNLDSSRRRPHTTSGTDVFY